MACATLHFISACAVFTSAGYPASLQQPEGFVYRFPNKTAQWPFTTFGLLPVCPEGLRLLASRCVAAQGHPFQHRRAPPSCATSVQTYAWRGWVCSVQI